jgi:hypothetical protein
MLISITDNECIVFMAVDGGVAAACSNARPGRERKEGVSLDSRVASR